MPDHWHMLIDFASFGDQIIFSDGEPDTSSIFVSCFRPGRWEIGARRVQLRGSAYQSNSGNLSVNTPNQLTTWDDLTADD